MAMCLNACRKPCSRGWLPDREQALREAHFPPEGTPRSRSWRPGHPALRRLIFEELFFLELGLELKRRRSHKQAGVALCHR